MDLKEWLQGFKGVSDHGFVGLQGIVTKEEATEVFEKIDNNGGGIVLLDEWSYYLKNCEIAMDTAVGRLLALDQEGGVGKKEVLFGGNPKAKPSIKGPSDLESGMGKLRAFIGKDKSNAVSVSGLFVEQKRRASLNGPSFDGNSISGIPIPKLLIEFCNLGIGLSSAEVLYILAPIVCA